MGIVFSPSDPEGAFSENSCYNIAVESVVKHSFVLEGMQTRWKGQYNAELTLSSHLPFLKKWGIQFLTSSLFFFPFQAPGFLFSHVEIPKFPKSRNYNKVLYLSRTFAIRIIQNIFLFFSIFFLQNYPIQHFIALNVPLIFICYSSSTETPKQESGS